MTSPSSGAFAHGERLEDAGRAPWRRRLSTGPPIQVIRASLMAQLRPGRVPRQPVELGEQFGGDPLAGASRPATVGIDAGVARPDAQSGAQPVRCRDVDRSTGHRAGFARAGRLGQPLRIDFHLQPIQMTQAATRGHAGAGGVAPALTRGGVDASATAVPRAGPAMRGRAVRGTWPAGCVAPACRVPRAACQRHFVFTPGVDHGLVHARPGFGSRPAHDVGRLRPGFVADVPCARILLAPQRDAAARWFVLRAGFRRRSSVDSQRVAHRAREIGRRASSADVRNDGEQRRERARGRARVPRPARSRPACHRAVRSRGARRMPVAAFAAASPADRNSGIDAGEPEARCRCLAADVDDLRHVSPAG